METLLNKVTDLEEEARRCVAQAERAGQQQLARVLAEEEKVLHDTAERAHQRGYQIIKEQVDAAASEINSLHEQEGQTIAALEARAEANRAAVVEFVVDLFNDTNARDL